MFLSTKSWLLVMLLFTCVGYAQVGIGTTDPDPSALLELDSDGQGILVPRMSTLDRIDITSPAEGLMVYDLDERSFYYYSAGSWLPISGSEKRTNHKLIKGLTDLSEELIAGGGSQYLLDSSYLYEINGSLNIDFPIVLNGAYLKGEDNIDDQLVNNTGGPLFVGSSGGNLRRLTIVGNSSPIFNITGSGAESLVSLSVNYTNASAIGSLNNMSSVHFNTGQFINNSAGITATDIASYLMTNFSWASTNSGIFLSLNGTFDDIQLSNACVIVDSGETGIDVSSNPTITGNASIVNVNFDGAGQNVNRYLTGSYTNYNFK